ncbi:MAG: hypothetical protein ABIT47_01935 [Candidatus Paceibacterota bacterium]
MKKTLTIIRALLPHLLVLTVILAPCIVFAADPTTSAAAAPTDGFIPLNPIPGIIDAGNSPNLPAFFNGLYKICIGAAATIAVLQIMRAGFLFMVNKGSVSGNEHAKSIITNSIIGLVLVLSPAIVFGIINPKILNLNLDVSVLKPADLKKVDVSAAGTDDNGVPLQGEQSGPTITVTGTLLKKGTFSTEAAMNTFIGQCSASAKSTPVANIPADGGEATTKGCTSTCSPANKGTCDAKGCNQYTAYCSVQSYAVANIVNKAYVPDSVSAYAWNQFVPACKTAGGYAKFKATSQPKSCFDADGKPQTCVDGLMTCLP